MKVACSLMMTIALVAGFASPGFSAELTSTTYNYSLNIPKGWVQTPANEVAKFNADLPPQAAGLIYDAAIQRNDRGWFVYPYVIVQVIPPKQSGLSRYPTEAQFESFLKTISNGKVITRVSDIVSSVQDTTRRNVASSMVAGFSKTTIQADLSKRRYSYVAEYQDQTSSPATALITGYFTADGSVIQLNSHSRTSEFDGNINDFLAIADSFHSKAVPASGLPFDRDSLLRACILFALIGGAAIWWRSKRVKGGT